MVKKNKKKTRIKKTKKRVKKKLISISKRKRKKLLKNKSKKSKKILRKKSKLKKNKKIKQPLDRILSFKFSKIKIKKIKIPKIKKKKFFNIKKSVGQVVKIKLQSVVNFILTPVFSAYDNYSANKRIKKLEKIAFEKKEKDKQKKEESRIRLEVKKKELQVEKKIEIERRKNLKKFISEDQALLRAEQAEEKRKVYEAMKIQRRLDQFAKREAKEIADLNRYALREQILEYSEVELRIDKIKKKYAEIRFEKFKKNYEEMGIDVQDSDTREILYEKHRIFEEQRKKVEEVMESYFRCCRSLLYSLNRKWLPNHLDILRIIDRRWEENLFYVRLDSEIEENWLQLCYLRDGKADKDKAVIVIEDKTADQYIKKEFKTSSIFEFSDWMVDRWTQFLDREFKKKKES